MKNDRLHNSMHEEDVRNALQQDPVHMREQFRDEMRSLLQTTGVDAVTDEKEMNMKFTWRLLFSVPLAGLAVVAGFVFIQMNMNSDVVDSDSEQQLATKEQTDQTVQKDERYIGATPAFAAAIDNLLVYTDEESVRFIEFTESYTTTGDEYPGQKLEEDTEQNTEYNTEESAPGINQYWLSGLSTRYDYIIESEEYTSSVMRHVRPDGTALLCSTTPQEYLGVVSGPKPTEPIDVDYAECFDSESYIVFETDSLAELDVQMQATTDDEYAVDMIWQTDLMIVDDIQLHQYYSSSRYNVSDRTNTFIYNPIDDTYTHDGLQRLNHLSATMNVKRGAAYEHRLPIGLPDSANDTELLVQLEFIDGSVSPVYRIARDEQNTPYLNETISKAVEIDEINDELLAEKVSARMETIDNEDPIVAIKGILEYAKEEGRFLNKEQKNGSTVEQYRIFEDEDFFDDEPATLTVTMDAEGQITSMIVDHGGGDMVTINILENEIIDVPASDFFTETYWNQSLPTTK